MAFKWDTDRIVSVCAMVVGVGSLGIILFQTQIMREQQRASGRLVPAGDWIQTLGTDGAEAGAPLLRELLHLFVVAEVPKTWLLGAGVTGPPSERAVVIVTYSSVYGERWHLRSDSFVPVAGPAPGVR